MIHPTDWDRLWGRGRHSLFRARAVQPACNSRDAGGQCWHGVVCALLLSGNDCSLRSPAGKAPPRQAQRNRAGVTHVPNSILA